MKAIDSHVHLVPSSKLFREWATMTGAAFALEGLEREMEENDVERAVLLGHWEPEDSEPSGPFTNRSNNELVEMMEAAGSDRFRALLTVNVRDEGIPDLDVLDDFLRKKAYPGVKFYTGYEPYSADDPRLEPVLGMLERRGAIAMFHTGDTLLESGHLKHAHPIPIDDVSNRHPKLRIVAAHAGQHWMHDAGEIVGKNANVHADLSGWFIGRQTPWFADYVQRQFQELVFWADGAEKLMYGTDWPLTRMAVYREFWERCDWIPEDKRRLMLYDNAKRLYWG